MSIILLRLYLVSLLLLLIQPICADAGEKPLGNSKAGNLLTFQSPQQLPPVDAAMARGALLSDGEPIIVLLRKSVDGHDLLGAVPGDSEWKNLGGIPSSDVVFRSKSTPDEWLLVSIDSERSVAMSIYRIFSTDGEGIQIAELASPPPLRKPTITRVENNLYLVGFEEKDQTSLRLYELNLSAKDPVWKRMGGMPDFAADSIALHVVHQDLLIFGEGADTCGGLAYSRLGGWTKLAAPPVGVTSATGIPCGETSLLFFGLADNSESVLLYNATLDRWVRLAEAPAGFMPKAALQTGGTEFILIGDAATIAGRAVLQSTNYGWVDHGVVFLFMAVMLWIGFRLSKRENSNQDYFRGGRRVPFWASGLSLFATGASAISLMAMPGMAFATDWTYMSISFYIMISTLVVLFVYVPLARRLDVATANEYLERRYGLTLRLIGSVIYSLNQILARLAAIMLLPAIALSAIIGMPMETSILIMGLVTTAYATMGGLEGVIWTDVIQAFVMILAVLLCSVWALLAMDMDFGTAFSTLQNLDKLDLFNPSFGLLGPTLFVLFMNAFVTVLGMIGDQNFIQRVQCTPSERDAKKAVITQILVAVPLNLVLFSLGTILFLFYLERPDMLNPTIKADGIFPVFAAQNLPPGLAGVVIAALFAATMSTLSSAINSTANIGVEDFFRRLRRTPPSDKACLRLGKVLTLALGLLGTTSAIWLANSDLRSVWDLAMMLTGMILGPITGFFLLGVFTRKAHSGGVLIGGFAAIAATVVCRELTPIHHFLYLPVGVGTCLIIGYAASWILPSGSKDLHGLTVYTLYRKSGQSSR